MKKRYNANEANAPAAPSKMIFSKSQGEVVWVGVERLASTLLEPSGHVDSLWGVFFLPNPMGHTAPGGYLEISECPEGGAGSEEEVEAVVVVVVVVAVVVEEVVEEEVGVGGGSAFFLPNPMGHTAPGGYLEISG